MRWGGGCHGHFGAPAQVLCPFVVEGNMLIDAHAHLDRYGNQLEIALQEIRHHRIFTVSNSMGLPSYRRNREIGEMCELVLPTFGVHPWNAPEYVDCLEDLEGPIQQSPILGEIGLDCHFVKDPSQYPAQRKVLEFFLTAAKGQGKIVNLHTKGAEREVLQLLNHYGVERAIVHWYSGPLDVFRDLSGKGIHFTIGVEVLYSNLIQTIARKLPEKLLLVETDNPGGLKWLTGNPGMPLVVKEVVGALADLRKTTVEDIAQTVQFNFEGLIRDDPWLSETHARVF